MSRQQRKLQISCQDMIYHVYLEIISAGLRGFKLGDSFLISFLIIPSKSFRSSWFFSMRRRNNSGPSKNIFFNMLLSIWTNYVGPTIPSTHYYLIHGLVLGTPNEFKQTFPIPINLTLKLTSWQSSWEIQIFTFLHLRYSC